MAQHDYVIANGTGAAVRSDLNSALAAIVSNNSGATEPTPTYAYQWWADTTTGLLKIRNAANNAWTTVGTLASANLGLLSSGGTVTAALGSASTPGITFTGDTNTGIYSPGADQVAISTNGTQRLAVDTAATTSTLPVVHPLGAVGTPSITFTGDLNTGIWSPAADTVAASTGGSERLRIDSSGRVGIGTTTPGNQNASASQLVVGNTSQNNGITILTGTTNDGVLNFNDGDNNSVRGYVIYEHSTDSLRFASNGSERFRCDSSGRLLVGTSSARGNLYNAGVSAQYQSENAGSTAIEYLATRVSNDTFGGTIALVKSRGTTVGSNTIVQSGDQVGVVSFQGSDGSEFVEAARIEAVVDAATGANDMPGRLVFSTCSDGSATPQERGRIDSKGYAMFSPNGTYYSNVAGGGFHSFDQTTTNWSLGARHTGSTPYGFVINYNTSSPNNATNEFLYCSDATAVRATIRSNGGLANYSANNANLSDRNAKKDISPAADTWDCIKEWEIVNYRYKDQPDDADLNLGVIAQQVAESCPEVITVFEEAKDDQPEKLGVKEQQMYWMAIKALQEAQVRIEALEAEVAALKAA